MNQKKDVLKVCDDNITDLNEALKEKNLSDY